METKKIYNLPDNPEELLSKIIDAYPDNDFQSLRKIIGIGRVQYQKEISKNIPMTAAVVNIKPYTLLFGREFLEENMQSIYDCVYILSHELTHLVLDHFALDVLREFSDKKLARSAVHIIVDCQVNATCYNSLKEEKYFEFIKRYYPKNEMPDCFFRYDGTPEFNVEFEQEIGEDGQPILENNKPKIKKILIPLEKEDKERLEELHKKLYSIDGITNKELIEGLMPWFKEQQDSLEETIKKLLGNHKDIFRDKTGENNGDDLDNLIESVAQDMQESLEKNKKESKETKEEQEGKKGALNTEKREKQIQICLDKIRYSKNIKKQLKTKEVISPSSRIYRAIDFYFPKRQSRSVIPNFYDRRTSTMYSQGVLPTFHNRSCFGSKIIVPCYLDVSGSQNHVIPYMLPVVSRLKQKIGNLVYCFSNYISETKISNLEVGKISTSGGTDFNPVIEHILKNKFKNAIILTDGEAQLSDNLKQKILNKKIDITIGWTVENPMMSPLDSIARRTFYVFKD